MVDRTAVALCDTVESLRAELAASKAFYDLTVSQRDQAWSEVERLHGLVLELDAELEILRGIAKRSADGWRLVGPLLGPDRWSWGHVTGQYEPLTEAEVHAIYGTEESDE